MNRHLYTIFTLLTLSLLATLSLILWRELNPEWMRYQKAFFLKEREKVIKALDSADDARRVHLQKRLKRLSRPRYRIRQILFDNGEAADRCITCHLDLEQLKKKHPEIERYPFEDYGCTVCHGGVGRATEKTMAHSLMRIPRRPLYEYLEAHRIGKYPIDLFNYNASGEQIPYTGSKICLRCHLGSHPRHVDRWRKLKFKPLDEVRNKLHEIRTEGITLEEGQCLGCHTTGYNEQKGRYLEDRVTCEGCHGPGEFYVDLMTGGRAMDGARIARVNILQTQADQICLNCHNPGRHREFEGADLPPALLVYYVTGKPAPELDGKPFDAAWMDAPETILHTWRLDEETPKLGPDILMRAVYNDSHLYFIFRWPDKTPQDLMGRWLYVDGQWQSHIEEPDALALHWQITDKVNDFSQGGCAILCHDTGRFKEFPRMATRLENALVDEWYWNAFVGKKTGRPGDGFLDNLVRSIPKSRTEPPLLRTIPEISAAHGSDSSGDRMPETMGGVTLLLNEQVKNLKPPFPNSHQEDNIMPLFKTATPEEGDSADILGTAAWSDGYWTLELGRPLRTASKRDIQFDPAAEGYSFGLAVWDGASEDRHQVVTMVKLSFKSTKIPEGSRVPGD